jgi:hypothetical protein
MIPRAISRSPMMMQSAQTCANVRPFASQCARAMISRCAGLRRELAGPGCHLQKRLEWR